MPAALDIRDFLADHRGIPSSDVRSIERISSMFAWEVRLWNHRRIVLAAFDLIRAGDYATRAVR